jgi:hypothetical protein
VKGHNSVAVGAAAWASQQLAENLAAEDSPHKGISELVLPNQVVEAD